VYIATNSPKITAACRKALPHLHFESSTGPKGHTADKSRGVALAAFQDLIALSHAQVILSSGSSFVGGVAQGAYHACGADDSTACVRTNSSIKIKIKKVRTNSRPMDRTQVHVQAPLRWSFKETPEFTHRMQSPQRHTVAHQLHNYGMGSDLLLWASDACAAASQNVTIVTLPANSLVGCDRSLCNVSVTSEWIWNPPGCSAEDPLGCYFDVHAHVKDRVLDAAHADGRKLLMRNKGACSVMDGSCRKNSLCSDIGTALVYLFSRIRRDLLNSAQAASGLVRNGMVTVHIRWGDKFKETALLPIQTYVNATLKLYGRRKAHIFVVTEDYAAYSAFDAEVSRLGLPWTVVANHASIQQDTRTSTLSPVTTARLKRTLGRESLISLILCLQAKYYILTPGSSWGRLVDALRNSLDMPTAVAYVPWIDKTGRRVQYPPG